MAYTCIMSAHHATTIGQEQRQRLRTAGLRATDSRVALLAELESATGPISGPDLVDRLAAKDWHRSTTYRMLDDLIDAGLVRPLDFRETATYYELADPEDHHHLVCTTCLKVERFDGCTVDQLATTALGQSRQFASIDSHALELFGTCRACHQAGA